MPWPVIETFLEELPKLEAERALLAVQISAYPHWSGTKARKHAGDDARKQFVARLLAAIHGPQPGHDAKGRFMTNSGAELRAWLLREGGIDAA